MNRLKRRQFGAKKQQKQQQRQYGRQNYQRRQYHKRNDDCEINITIDDEPGSEPEPVKPVERVPFNGERDIKKCYFQYTSFNSVKELLRDSVAYKEVCEKFYQISQQLSKVSVEEREKLREQLCVVGFEKYIHELTAISIETKANWSDDDIKLAAKQLLKGDNIKFCGVKVIIEFEELIDKL